MSPICIEWDDRVGKSKRMKSEKTSNAFSFFLESNENHQPISNMKTEDQHKLIGINARIDLIKLDCCNRKKKQSCTFIIIENRYVLMMKNVSFIPNFGAVHLTFFKMQSRVRS